MLEERTTPAALANAFELPLEELASLNLAWSRRAVKNGMLLPKETLVWLPEGRDVVPRSIRILDPERGEAMVADRERMIRTYDGTPFGEQVVRNRVYTYRVVWRPVGRGLPDKATPGESHDKPPTTPRGGSSGGGGPTTGR